MKSALILCLALIVAPVCAFAQVELSFSVGAQPVQPANVAIRDPLLGSVSNSVQRETQTFDRPLYYGIRATRWRSDAFGLGLDFAHSKGNARATPNDYAFLELGDDLNTLTANAYRRWNDVIGTLTPYVGGGLGIAVPHVDVRTGPSTRQATN